MGLDVALALKREHVRRQRSPRSGAVPGAGSPGTGTRRYFAGVSVSVSFVTASTASGVNAHGYCSPTAQPFT
ncbi:hypothetical protein ACI1US_00189 [Leucobacter sp. BZR 635]